ncbi:MAG TPA: hypothetical protein VKS01_04010 [Bryobacteraceae bacterium]|nr:hypothetical protein [Bryobacteraceae bacterium]
MKLLLCLLTASSLFAAVDGIVMNGTTGKPQGAVEVSLLQPGAGGMQTLAHVKSSADGSFSIEARIPPGPAIIQAMYQGVAYHLVVTPGTPTTGLRVPVYEATKDLQSAKIAQHMLVIEPSSDALQISETFLAQNTTQRTFDDPTRGSVEFFVPEAARDKVNVTIAAPGGMPINRPAESTKKPGIYKASYPLKPGETRFDVNYSLPAAASFTGRNPDASTPINIVTPSTVTLSGDGIEPRGREPQTQANIYTVSTPEFTAQIEGTGSLRSPGTAQDADNGQPQPKVEAPRIYSRLGWVLAFAFAILALGGAMLYRKGEA